MGDRSKHFSTWELECQGKAKGTCNCGGSSPVDRILLVALDKYRDKIGNKVTLNRAFSCLVHNASVGSDDTSQHPKGTAADIRKLSGMSIHEMRSVALEIPEITAIGMYDWGVHIDVRPPPVPNSIYPVMWDERTQE